MLDIHSMLAQLKRPTLLVKAARFGVDDYRREAELAHFLGQSTQTRPAEVLIQLLDLERSLNEKRTGHDALYSYSDHIRVLTAIMAETRLLKATPLSEVAS